MESAKETQTKNFHPSGLLNICPEEFLKLPSSSFTANWGHCPTTHLTSFLLTRYQREHKKLRLSQQHQDSDKWFMSWKFQDGYTAPIHLYTFLPSVINLITSIHPFSTFHLPCGDTPPHLEVISTLCFKYFHCNTTISELLNNTFQCHEYLFNHSTSISWVPTQVPGHCARHWRQNCGNRDCLLVLHLEH